MDIFDILGPVMVGPSSSHTAGAVRIGKMAAEIFGQELAAARIGLYGSFAETGRGHGTDRALVAGLLGMAPDDSRIPESLELARAGGLRVEFYRAELREAHPNTAVLTLTGRDERQLEIQAASVGGGRIIINKLDGVAVDFSGELNTLIIFNHDEPGPIGGIATLLSQAAINIASMKVYRGRRGGQAVMVIETDEEIPAAVAAAAREIPQVVGSTYVPRRK